MLGHRRRCGRRRAAAPRAGKKSRSKKSRGRAEGGRHATHAPSNHNFNHLTTKNIRKRPRVRGAGGPVRTAIFRYPAEQMSQFANRNAIRAALCLVSRPQSAHKQRQRPIRRGGDCGHTTQRCDATTALLAALKRSSLKEKTKLEPKNVSCVEKEAFLHAHATRPLLYSATSSPRKCLHTVRITEHESERGDDAAATGRHRCCERGNRKKYSEKRLRERGGEGKLSFGIRNHRPMCVPVCNS